MQLARKSLEPGPKSQGPNRAALLRLAIALGCVLTSASIVPGLGAGPAFALEPVEESTAFVIPNAQPEEEGWHVFEAVAEGFRALLPRDETWEESNLRETVIGTVSEKKYFARGDDGRVFSVGLHMLPKLGKLFAPSSLILSTARKNVLITDGGREVSYERTRIGDYPGAHLTYEPTREGDDYGLMEAHLVLVGRKLYVLKASHVESTRVSGDTDLFFRSFEVIE